MASCALASPSSALSVELKAASVRFCFCTTAIAVRICVSLISSVRMYSRAFTSASVARCTLAFMVSFSSLSWRLSVRRGFRAWRIFSSSC